MRIMFFAQLRPLAGVASAEVEADGIDGGQLWKFLEKRWPALAGHRASVRLARNGTYATPDEVFHAGDEVALIPPVSGG
jgi:sulfur-carrier protein